MAVRTSRGALTHTQTDSLPCAPIVPAVPPELKCSELHDSGNLVLFFFVPLRCKYLKGFLLILKSKKVFLKGLEAVPLKFNQGGRSPCHPWEHPETPASLGPDHFDPYWTLLPGVEATPIFLRLDRHSTQGRLFSWHLGFPTE